MTRTTASSASRTAGAAAHFKNHLQRYPDQIMVRAYLAELLFKLSKLPDAQDQYERFIAEAQQNEGPARQHRPAHGFATALAARRTARTMRLWVPQRQRLRARPARTSFSVGRGLPSRSAFAVMIMPLMQ